MKKVNGITVYEENDPCALDEYSNQLEKDLTVKFDAIEKENEQESNDISTLQNKVKSLEKETEEQQNQIIELQNKVIILEDQIPTGQASGNPIHIDDSSNMPLTYRLNGGDRQESRDGSNKLVYPYENTTKTTNGITFTDNGDGTITANGTATSKAYFNLSRPTLKPGSYTVSIEPADGANVSPFKYFFKFGNVNVTSSYKFEFTESFTPTESYLCINDGVTVNNLTFKPMLVEGNNVLPYQPYGAMPSPNYPSNIETVGSNVNEFSFENAEKIASYSIPSFEVINNNTIELKSSTDWAYVQYQYVLKANTEYTISYDLEFDGVENISKWWISIDDEQGSIYSNYITLSNNKFIKTFIPKTENVKIKFYASIYDGKQIIPILTTIRNIKIEKGTKATPYSKYGQGSVEIDVVNKNLFDFSNNYLENAGIDSTGKIISSSYKVNYCKVKSGKTYTLSRPTSMQYVITTTKNEPKINEQGTTRIVTISKDYTITIPEGYNYICIRHIGAGNEDNIDLQIELGETTTEKVEHQSQTKIVPIQEEMLEDDYIEDVEYHTWGKVVLDGTEVWNLNPAYSNVFYTSKPQDLLQNETNLKCNMTKNVILNANWSNYDDGIAVGGSLNFKDSSIQTVDELKSKLAQNNLIIYYKLATPKSLPLTEEQKKALEGINTYENVTNISTDNELATLDISYKKDIETLINNIMAKINTIITNEEA